MLPMPRTLLAAVPGLATTGVPPPRIPPAAMPAASAPPPMPPAAAPATPTPAEPLTPPLHAADRAGARARREVDRRAALRGHRLRSRGRSQCRGQGRNLGRCQDQGRNRGRCQARVGSGGPGVPGVGNLGPGFPPGAAGATTATATGTTTRSTAGVAAAGRLRVGDAVDVLHHRGRAREDLGPCGRPSPAPGAPGRRTRRCSARAPAGSRPRPGCPGRWADRPAGDTARAGSAAGSRAPAAPDAASGSRWRPAAAPRRRGPAPRPSRSSPGSTGRTPRRPPARSHRRSPP